MPVSQSEIKFYLSGGGANSDPAASLGGVKSSTEVVVSTLWDDVEPAESTAGDTEYRCIYVENTNGVDTLTSAVFWRSADTASGATELTIGLGTSAIDGTEQTVADEDTAPAGVSFSAPTTKGAGLAIGDLTPGQHKALWLRRVINAGTGSTSETASINVGGLDT